MTPVQALIFVAVLLPVILVGVWLLVTTLLVVFAGWRGLSTRFPDRNELPVAVYRMQSGMMGVVRMNGALTLSPCRGGLRLALMKVLAPFSKPIFVPWTEVVVEPRARFLGPTTLLTFGRPRAGSLEMTVPAAERILRHKPD